MYASQGFQDFELILVDDGSMDDTAVVCESYKKLPINYSFQKNAERGAARNHGVNLASGQYVFFMDSDDRVDSGFLEEAHALIQKHANPEWAHLRFDTINEHAQALYEKPIIDSSIQDKLLDRNYLAAACFLRIDIAREFQFSENRSFNFGEDWYLWLRLSRRFPLRFSNTIHYHQLRESTRSDLNAASPESLEENMNLMIRLLREDEKTNDPFILRKVRSQYLALISLEEALVGNKRAALNNIIKAISLNPLHLTWKKTYAVFKKALF